MEIKVTELEGHASEIARVFGLVWNVTMTAPLIELSDDESSSDVVITVRGGNNSPLPVNTVTTDLGRIEKVVGLPIPTSKTPKFWIGLHESWQRKGKRMALFNNCGLRVYIGEANEDCRQLLRLEWAAPETTKDGELVYQGKHAGHPHWQIDQAALVGTIDHLRSLEILTAPSSQEPPLESFGTVVTGDTPRLIPDLSWFPGVHLPAQSQWMHHKWDGVCLPAPHQSTPKALKMLTTWWEGSLRYIFMELLQHSSH